MRGFLENCCLPNTEKTRKRPMKSHCDVLVEM